MLNRIVVAEVRDTTGDDSSSRAKYIKKQSGLSPLSIAIVSLNLSSPFGGQGA